MKHNLRKLWNISSVGGKLYFVMGDYKVELTQEDVRWLVKTLAHYMK